MSMRNKLKIVLIVVGVLAGMIAYKAHHDKHAKDKDSDGPKKRAHKHDYN